MAHIVGDHAIVLGGSIGGSLAARALADYFRHVTILERDELVDEPQPRKGTPHARHTHGLLARGLEIIEQMLPGTCAELARHDVQQADILGRCLWHAEGGYHVQFDSGLIGTGQSRALLEWIVRRQIARLPNVGLRDQVSVTRLLPDAHRQRIVGVELTDRRTGSPQSLEADLVIDATGRGSKLPAWLADLGYRPPVEERVEIDLAYATRLYRRREADLGGNLAVIYTLTPPSRRFAATVQQEGQTWSLTMGGLLGDHPPLDEAGFLEFARGLPAPEIYEFLLTAEPISKILPYRFPASMRRRYERVRLPEGILPLGDSLSSFNPVYGQGMTIAAAQARLLGLCLAEGLDGLTPRYLRESAKRIDTAWQISVGSDLRYPQVRGRRPWGSSLVNAYLARVHRAAQRDPDVALAFHHVTNLLAPPSSLFSFGMLRRVLWPRPMPEPQRRPVAGIRPARKRSASNAHSAASV